MPKLYILSPSSVARTIDLTNNLITIGRTEETEICIPDHNISKRHGILVRDGDDYQLHDFKSTNGTFVDGKRIMAVKLQHGVSIRLGSVELRYESTPANAGLIADQVTPLGLKSAEQPALLSSGGGRGIAKRVKPDSAPGMLQAGPVTFQPGSLAKPIPPVPHKTSDADG
jgi:pSer/pThr/pTyr-binding forkhead associated (FHA) protein